MLWFEWKKGPIINRGDFNRNYQYIYYNITDTRLYKFECICREKERAIIWSGYRGRLKWSHEESCQETRRFSHMRTCETSHARACDRTHTCMPLRGARNKLLLVKWWVVGSWEGKERGGWGSWWGEGKGRMGELRGEGKERLGELHPSGKPMCSKVNLVNVYANQIVRPNRN